MSDQLKDELFADIQILIELAPPKSILKSLDCVFKDYLLGLKQDAIPNNFEEVIADFYYLQNFIEKLERKLK
jgi:hypothetical protein